MASNNLIAIFCRHWQATVLHFQMDNLLQKKSNPDTPERQKGPDGHKSYSQEAF
jgi:hypothetical protein